MASNDFELAEEIRTLTGYTDHSVLTPDDMDTVIHGAKRWIIRKRGIDTSDGFDWYLNEQREDALYWVSCLFARIAAGELEAPQAKFGRMDLRPLLAKADNEWTLWYREAIDSIKNLEPTSGTGHIRVARDNRVYGEDSDAGL